jgi:hypothetical protein
MRSVLSMSTTRIMVGLAYGLCSLAESQRQTRSLLCVASSQRMGYS